MSCCGQKRQQWQASVVQREPPKAMPEPVLENPVAIVYRGSGSYLVTGKESGHLYLFGEKEPRMLVDGRDVAFLLAEGERFLLG